MVTLMSMLEHQEFSYSEELCHIRVNGHPDPQRKRQYRSFDRRRRSAASLQDHGRLCRSSTRSIQSGDSFPLACLRQLAALGDFPLGNIDHEQLTALTGIFAVLDVLFFLLPQGAGLLLDFFHITSYLLAWDLGYLIVSSNNTWYNEAVEKFHRFRKIPGDYW